VPRWWDVEFFPFLDKKGLLRLLGKIVPVASEAAFAATSVPEKVIDMCLGLRQRYAMEHLSSNVPAGQRVLEQVRLACQTTTPVFVTGEPGSGKHWVARTIHHQGPSRCGAFVRLDCARLPVPMLAAALFGTEGPVLPVRQGTQFLQEPQCLPHDLQARLIETLGEAEGVRTVVACSADPATEIRTGRLYEELFYALSPLVITVPPLRERIADLPRLVERMLVRVQEGEPARVVGLTPQAWEAFRLYHWPENLRELYATLQSACRRAPADRLDVDHLPAKIRLTRRLEETPGPQTERALPLDKLLEQVEHRLILLTLQKSMGNRSRAAELLAISRPRLLRRMELLGIDASCVTPKS
jgi:DNA-binding NtrC family response regulator